MIDNELIERLHELDRVWYYRHLEEVTEEEYEIGETYDDLFEVSQALVPEWKIYFDKQIRRHSIVPVERTAVRGQAIGEEPW